MKTDPQNPASSLLLAGCLALAAGLTPMAQAQTDGFEWTWMKGASTVDAFGTGQVLAVLGETYFAAYSKAPADEGGAFGAVSEGEGTEGERGEN